MSKKSSKKAYKKSKWYTWGAIIVLILSLLGVKVPGVVTDFFEINNGTAKQTDVGHQTSTVPKESGKSTFTNKELELSNKGWITYQALDKLGRPTGADALLTKSMIGTGSKANKEIKPPGFISGLSPYGHSRGHLIGNQFGGSGNEKKNLVTIYQNPVNSPYMTSYEGKVRDVLNRGGVVRYRVVPLYDGDKLMPAAIEMQGKSLKGKALDFKVIIPNVVEQEATNE
ncbi:DNA/RNA non-specific endonuclease [Vagococcus xieshaowenii]|uniref:DNA-entry nuclease n=1 Tax=Vagococcus xieshaowenii TaxID=2562451 RepID=A0AAJ5EE44_9ENTE|nr:DNA/RNA non-specific endonuclease [Vagococcus xieshaowenii]QCA29080.1 DNA-entry nuclease [Vagococcus xieshaowenii]TFZ40944.1 DNA-entry nuclease [Vagococcus xieshaowenii]